MTNNKKLNNSNIKLGKNIAAKNKKMTCESEILQCFASPYSASVVDLMENSGINWEYVKNDYEFGIRDVLNKTQNNHSLEFPIILQDYSGIPRIDACYNSVYAFKPTYGTFSRYGVASVANSFDQLSITSDNLEEIYNLANILASKDDKDQNSINNYSFKSDFSTLNYSNIKIAIPKEIYTLIEDSNIISNFKEIVDKLKKKGITIEEIETEFLQNSLKTHLILSNIEISSNMSRYDALVYGYRTEEYDTIEEMYGKSRQEGLGIDIKTRILLGNYLISAQQKEKNYNTAIEMRKSIKNMIDEIFEKYDLIMTPTVLFDYSKYSNMDNLTDLFKNELFTHLPNLLGNPTIQVPISQGNGLQLIAGRLKDIDVFKGSKLVEEARNE